MGAPAFAFCGWSGSPETVARSMFGLGIESSASSAIRMSLDLSAGSGFQCEQAWNNRARSTHNHTWKQPALSHHNAYHTHKLVCRSRERISDTLLPLPCHRRADLIVPHWERQVDAVGAF